MKTIRRIIRKAAVRLFILFFLCSSIAELATSCKKETFTEKWLREYSQRVNVQDDDSDKSTPDPVEKVYGETTVTFSVQPGDTLYTLGGDGYLEYTVDGDPEAVGVSCKYGGHLPCEVEKTEKGGIIKIDGFYFANLKDRTMPEETYTDYHHANYNHDFTVTVYIKQRTLTDENGRVTTVDAKCDEYKFHHRIYSLKYESGLHNEDYKTVTPVTEGFKRKYNYTGVNLPAEGGSFTFDTKDFVILTWPKQAPELETMDVFNGATVVLNNDSNYMKAKGASGPADWIHFDGLTVTADANDTEYGRWVSVNVVLGEPFDGEILRTYNNSGMFCIYQEPGSPKKVDGCVWFKDPELKHALLRHNSVTIDTDGDGEISYEEALASEEISVEPGLYNVTDATGLEAFRNVHKFCMQKNDFTNLSVLGTYQNLNWLDLKGCDKLDSNTPIDLRGCRQYFKYIDISDLPEATVCKYETQLVGLEDLDQSLSESFLAYIDHRRSSDFSGQYSIHKVKDRTQDGNIIVCFLFYGFLDIDYQDGTVSEYLNDVILNAWKTNKYYAPYYEKIDFYYMKYISECRCPDYEGWKYEYWGNSDPAVREFSNSLFFNAAEKRKALLHLLFDELVPGHEDEEDFRFIVDQVCLSRAKGSVYTDGPGKFQESYYWDQSHFFTNDYTLPDLPCAGKCSYLEDWLTWSVGVNESDPILVGNPGWPYYIEIEDIFEVQYLMERPMTGPFKKTSNERRYNKKHDPDDFFR